MPAEGPDPTSGDPFAWVGATVNGKYRIDAVVGEGGFGVVYKAHHLGFEESVAVKCLRIPAGLEGQDRERFFASFMEEGRLLHRLSRSSAGIVQALDVGGAESPSGKWTPYIVLEWLEGMTLEADLTEREVRRLGGRPLAEALELLDPAARALGLVHEQGIAHRDIKPANLFLADVGGRRMLKILDFGIAKVLTETASLTRAFQATGMSLQAFSPRYGAPEQFSRRFGATGPWTDVFALALVLVEVTSGRLALDGEDAAQLFVSAVDPARRPTLRNCGVEIADAIEGVLAVALAIQPQDRYVAATDFWDALLAAAQASGVPLPASATRGLMPSVVSVEPAVPAPVSARGTPLDSRPGVRAAQLASTQLAATSMSRGSVTPDTRPTPARIALAALASTTVFALAAGMGVLLIGDDGEHREASSLPSAPRNEAPPPPTARAAAGSVKSPSRTSKSTEPAVAEPSPLLSPFAVPEGRAAEKAPWFPDFRVDPGPPDGYPTVRAALASCEKKSMSLCTELQWERACVSERGLASRATWVLSAATDGFAVRGGATCGDRRLIAGTAAASGGQVPGAVCCERAIGIATTNYLSSFLAATATRLLAVERAFNSHDAEAFGDLLADKVGVDGRYQTRDALKQSMTTLFSEHLDQKLANGTCKVSMQQVVVPKKRYRRRRAPAPPAPTWTAECEQLRYRSNEAAVIVTSYAFSGSGKLKSLSDGATQREWSPP